MKHVRSFLLCLLFAALAAAPAQALEPLPARALEPLPVVVSILPQKYLLERIAGDAVKVTVLVGPGAEPHTYEPTPSQMKEASQAGMYFTLGLPFEEAWVPRLAGSAPQLKVISTIAGVKRAAGHDHSDHEHEGHDDEHGHADHKHEQQHDGHGHTHGEDPHTWLSPALVRQIAKTMTEHLCESVPARAETFRANAARLDADIVNLSESISSKFKEFPAERRLFLTFHPTWGHFAEEYGLTELSIEVDGKEPSAKAMAQIIKTAKTNGLRTVFVEPQFSQSSAKAIAENIDAKIVEVNPLEENWFDLMNRFTDALVASFRTNRPPAD